MRERAQARARRAIARLEKVPLGGLRSTWASLLLLILVRLSREASRAESRSSYECGR